MSMFSPSDNKNLKFKKGDQVVLKSGGPVMTVEGYELNKYQCTWFDGVKHQSAFFVEEALEAPKAAAVFTPDVQM